MERNYDEIISEMLRQIDRHAEELEATIKKSDEQWAEQKLINAAHLARLDASEQRSAANFEKTQATFDEHKEKLKELQTQHDRNLELYVHASTILDRIIKKNSLKL